MHRDFLTQTKRLVIAGALAGGCRSDSPPSGTSDPGSSSSSGGLVSSTTTVVPDADSSTTAQGSSSEGSSTGLATQVRMSGTIEDFFAMGPIADSPISVLGMPSLQTQSDAEGRWSFDAVPVDRFDRFIVPDSASYWGAIIPFQTEYDDLEEVELSQVSLQVIDIQIGVLQQQDETVMVNEDASVFLVALKQNTATGAVVTVEPPPQPNAFYAPDANGQPTLGTSEIQWGIYPVAVFFNLDPGPEGTYAISVTHPERTCTVEDPEPPTRARHVNLIRVDCPPPE